MEATSEQLNGDPKEPKPIMIAHVGMLHSSSFLVMAAQQLHEMEKQPILVSGENIKVNQAKTLNEILEQDRATPYKRIPLIAHDIDDTYVSPAPYHKSHKPNKGLKIGSYNSKSGK